MSDELKSETLSAEPQHQRNPRVPVNFKVDLEGRLPNGDQFHVQAEAILISRQGATLLSDAELPVGIQVRLKPPFNDPLDGEINGVWIDSTDGRQRIGVKLLDPDGWFAE